MIVKCPRCESEYDLELDDVVVEMTFSCPNCKNRFIVRNAGNALLKPVSHESDASRYQPPQQSSVQKTEDVAPIPEKKGAETVEMPQGEARETAEPVKKSISEGTRSKKVMPKKKIALWLIVCASLLVVGVAFFQMCSHDTFEGLISSDSSKTKGRAIMLVMDISSSMLAEDLKPNRMEAAKEIARQIIESHTSDSIGIIAFAGESFTAMPMTNFADTLNYELHRVDARLAQDGVITDGTAIGMGIANAICYLSKSQAVHKMIILFTDGENNHGEVSPMMAADLARENGISIYTIGIGSDGNAQYPMKVGGNTRYVTIPVSIDTVMLGRLAKATGGQFFRASTKAEMEAACTEIDRAEVWKDERLSQSEATDRDMMNAETAQRVLNMVERKDLQIQKRINRAKYYEVHE